MEIKKEIEDPELDKMPKTKTLDPIKVYESYSPEEMKEALSYVGVEPNDDNVRRLTEALEGTKSLDEGLLSALRNRMKAKKIEKLRKQIADLKLKLAQLVGPEGDTAPANPEAAKEQKQDEKDAKQL